MQHSFTSLGVTFPTGPQSLGNVYWLWGALSWVVRLALVQDRCHTLLTQPVCTLIYLNTAPLILIHFIMGILFHFPVWLPSTWVMSEWHWGTVVCVISLAVVQD